MNAYVNELSLHGQFATTAAFFEAMKRLLRIHRECARFGTAMYCSRTEFAGRPAVGEVVIRDAIYAHCPRDLRSLILSWLDRTGPFWDEGALHDRQAWYVVRHHGREDLATQTGIAECLAYCLNGGRGVAVSVTPSDFTYTPIVVETEPDGGIPTSHALDNYWEINPLSAAIEAEQPLASWADLERSVRAKFQQLCIAPEAFRGLGVQPFSRAVADEITVLLDVLNRVSGCVGAGGQLDETGTELHRTYFVGHRPRFSDSSDDEKIDFVQDLTFPNPNTGRREMFPWHGKIRLDVQYRIHFEWPKRDPSRPLPVVYIGPKLTKR